MAIQPNLFQLFAYKLSIVSVVVVECAGVFEVFDNH